MDELRRRNEKRAQSQLSAANKKIDDRDNLLPPARKHNGNAIVNDIVEVYGTSSPFKSKKLSHAGSTSQLSRHSNLARKVKTKRDCNTFGLQQTMPRSDRIDAWVNETNNHYRGIINIKQKDKQFSSLDTVDAKLQARKDLSILSKTEDNRKSPSARDKGHSGYSHEEYGKHSDNRLKSVVGVNELISIDI